MGEGSGLSGGVGCCAFLAMALFFFEVAASLCCPLGLFGGVALAGAGEGFTVCGGPFADAVGQPSSCAPGIGAGGGAGVWPPGAVGLVFHGGGDVFDSPSGFEVCSQGGGDVCGAHTTEDRWESAFQLSGGTLALLLRCSPLVR